MSTDILQCAINKLGKEFEEIEWKYLDAEPGSRRDKTQLWPGEKDEDVMICVYKGTEFLELFHRQNFFFFNFAYQGDYNAFSYHSSNHVIIQENECYIGQPYAGYSIHDKSEEEKIIVGVLIQSEAFFKTFFHVLASSQHLFEFFLAPQINEYSEDYIQLKFENAFSVRNLLELMIVEYANKTSDTQDILRPLTLALLMQVARESNRHTREGQEISLAEQIVLYIGEHIDHCTLSDIGKHFGYHPNYISTILPRDLGKTFSEIVLEQRMERAVRLLKGTSLSIAEISDMLGYSNSSNFYKAFKEYYKKTPREYLENEKH